MAQHFDAIVVGTGQAGPPLAGRLSNEGMKVAIIERKKFGGTCVNYGCIPTKTLVASARAAYVARRGADFGVEIEGSIRVNMKKVKERMDQVSGQSNRGVEKWLKGLQNCTVFEGHARFEDASTISVEDRQLTSDRIFINVGARAYTPPIAGLDQVEYFTSSEMMGVDFLPQHLVIVGGSYIGLEFAQMYRRFGSRVTVVEKGHRLISREDEDVSQAILEILKNEGVEVRLNAECIQLGRRGENVAVGLECSSDDKQVEGSHLLLAVGRTPNTHDLGLDRTGVEVDTRGYIQVDERLRTSTPGIWALGDCNGQGAFTHTAYNDFEIVAANLLDQDPRRVTDRIPCYGLFVDPPLGRVGMTEAEVHRSGRSALVGFRPMKWVGRAKEKGETQGFMKVLVDADSEKILGAVILGVGGDEAVHCILDIMYSGSSYRVIQRAVHIHPTVAELIPTILGELKPLR